MDMTEIFT